MAALARGSLWEGGRVRTSCQDPKVLTDTGRRAGVARRRAQAWGAGQNSRVPVWRGYGGALPRSTEKGGDSQRPGKNSPVMGYKWGPQGANVAFRSCPGPTSLQFPKTIPGQAQQNALVPGSLRPPLPWGGGLREHPNITIDPKGHLTWTGGTC